MLDRTPFPTSLTELPIGTAMIPQSEYRDNLEAIAQLAEQHAGIVIWVDTPDLEAAEVPVGTDVADQVNVPIYNGIARDVAVAVRLADPESLDDPGHGFGLGVGTDAQGWVEFAIEFWRNHASGNARMLRTDGLQANESR